MREVNYRVVEVTERAVVGDPALADDNPGAQDA